MAVVINVVGNFDEKELVRARKELEKLGPSSSKTGGTFKTSLGGMTKGLIGLAGGAFAITQISQGFVNLAKEAQESAAVSRTTDAIIKSTGGTAKVTADQVSQLATSLSNKTGIDDEAIQSASNLLLTFKQVRNETGKGNQMFDRATQAALDLSKAGFGSVDGAAKMLGKALNDPIKGIAALSRAGVTFTDQQKEQITTLQKSGKTLEAQKLIMAEVESQVGGVAEATASPLERLQTIIGNFKEELGAKLLPVITKLADAILPILDKVAGPLGDVVGTIADALKSAFEQLAPVIPPIAEALGTVAKVVGGFLASALKALMPAITPIIEQLAKLINDIAPILAPILGKIAQLFGAIMTALAPLIPVLVRVVEQIFKAAAPILEAVIDVLIGLVKAFAPLIPVIAKLLPPLTRIVMVVLKALMPIIKPLLPLITGLAELMATHLAGAVEFLTNALNTLLPYFEKAIGWVSGFWSNITETFGSLGSNMLEVGKNIVTGIWDGINGAGSWLKDKIMEWASDLLPDWVKDILGIEEVKKAGKKIVKQTELVLSEIKTQATRVAQTTAKPVQQVADTITQAAKSVNKASKDMAKASLEAADTALAKYKDKAKAFFDFRNQIRDSLIGGANLGSIQMGDGFTPNAQGITSYLQDKLRQIKDFGAQLKSLKSLGLNNTSLQEIISAGPDTGGKLAAALLAEGQKAISEVNTLEAQISNASKLVGVTGAESQFGMSLANAQGMLTTNVTMKDGAVVINFGTGTSKADAAEIKQAVQDAIKKALQAAAQEAKR